MSKLHFKIFFPLLLIFSCYSDDGNSNESKKIEKILIDVGDSLTAGAGGNGISITNTTKNLLGDEWTVLNMGVGGENTLTIGARQGGIPMYIPESIIIPNDGSEVVIPNLLSTLNNESISPLLQGDNGINPCLIDTIKCQLSFVNNNYYIKRIHSNNIPNYTTTANSIIKSNLSKQTSGVQTIFIGQNGGYDSAEDFLEQLDLFVEHKGDENVIIITSHKNVTSEIIDLVSNRFENKHIDLKKYMSTNAISDAINIGLLPNDGQYPTSDDIEAMANNNTPPSLLYDLTHFNSIGYELVGRLRYHRGIELGYW
jgi:hypothetical protein